MQITDSHLMEIMMEQLQDILQYWRGYKIMWVMKSEYYFQRDVIFSGTR